jgi:hypothetical protein
VRAGKKSDATLKIQRVRAGHFARLLGDEFWLAKFAAPVVDGYISQRRAEGASEHTLHEELSLLRMALKHALRAGLWTGVVERVMPVGFSPAYTPRNSCLTRPELNWLFAELLPDRAARVAFIVATSAEKGATDRARREDVKVVDGDRFVLVRGTKNPLRWRTVPIATPFERELLEYALKHAEGEGGMEITANGARRKDRRGYSVAV